MEESKLRKHVVADPHLMRPESAANYPIADLQAWHDKDHSLASINRRHTHEGATA